MYILPIENDSYLFSRAENPIDAFNKLSVTYPNQTEGRTYKDMMNHKDYLKTINGKRKNEKNTLP